MYFNSEETLILRVLLENQIKINNKDITEAQNNLSNENNYYKMLDNQLIEVLEAQNNILKNIINKLNK